MYIHAPSFARHSSEGERVGILGIGGLGHMGIKFAKALGRKVTAFSRSDAKKEATLAMGADVHVKYCAHTSLPT